jgi:hypothetical protein
VIDTKHQYITPLDSATNHQPTTETNRHPPATHRQAACPRATRWVVVTNGDNAYDPGFLRRLVAEGEGAGADTVAFDYYSRFQRPTGEAGGL